MEEVIKLCKAIPLKMVKEQISCTLTNLDSLVQNKPIFVSKQLPLEKFHN